MINSKTKTILQVIPALAFGGIGLSIVENAKRIVESGYKSIIISSGGSLVSEILRNGSQHIEMNVATKNPFVIWRNSYKIAKIINRYNVDILHAISRSSAWSCYMASKKSKNCKFFTTFYGIYNSYNPINKFYNSIITKGDKIIAISEFVKDHILSRYNIDPSKIEVVRYGINPEKPSDELLEKFRKKYLVKPNIPVILLPARMTQRKGHLILIEALRKIRDLDFYCIMVGDMSKRPNYVKKIKEKIHEYKMQHHIQLFGNESSLIGLYTISDIVVSPSIDPEAFNRTIIEAQSMKKIAIATNIGSSIKNIKNNHTGFHVKPNDINDLADKISYCLNNLNSQKIYDIRNNAFSHIKKNHSLDLNLDKLLSLYQSS